MKPESHKQPAIRQGWLRVLLFCVFYFALLVLAGFVMVYFHAGSGKNAAAPVPYLIFIVDAIISVAIVWLFRKMIDRKSFNSMGFAIDKNGVHAGTGFFLGVLLLCVGSCILYFSHNLAWTDIEFNGNDLFISFGLMVIVALYEEIVFRGYILNNLMQSLNKWWALLVSACIFAIAHLANPQFSVIAAVNILLAGGLLGLNYIYTRNLWFGIALHFAWNFIQGPVLGYPVSGLELHSLLQHTTQGTELLTGGKFGFEGSLIATVLCLLSIGAFIWVYEKKYTSWPILKADADDVPAI